MIDAHFSEPGTPPSHRGKSQNTFGSLGTAKRQEQRKQAQKKNFAMQCLQKKKDWTVLRSVYTWSGIWRMFHGLPVMRRQPWCDQDY